LEISYDRPPLPSSAIINSYLSPGRTEEISWWRAVRFSCSLKTVTVKTVL